MPGALVRSIYLYSSTSSAQAADHSLPRPRESSLPPLRLLSHPQPLRSTGDGARRVVLVAGLGGQPQRALARWEPHLN